MTNESVSSSRQGKRKGEIIDPFFLKGVRVKRSTSDPFFLTSSKEKHRHGKKWHSRFFSIVILVVVSPLIPVPFLVFACRKGETRIERKTSRIWGMFDQATSTTSVWRNEIERDDQYEESVG